MRRTRTRVLAAAATTLLTTLAMAAGVNAASATPSSHDDDRYSPGLLSAMHRDLGLKKQDAVALLDSQAVAAQTQARLTKQLGAAYAGSWFDAKKRVLHVGVTDPAEDAVVQEAGAEPFHGDDSAAKLDKWVAALDATIDPHSAGSYYVDVANNQIVIDYLQTHLGEVKHAVRRAHIPHKSVEYVKTTQPPQTAIDVIGGDPYIINSTNRCSVGFPTTGNGFVTAGHCGVVGATTTNPAGTFTLSSFPGDDYAFVQVATGNTLIPAVNTFAGSSVNVAGATPAAVGAAVCRAGSTTGWRCGVLQSLNTTVNYAQGAVYGLLKTSACAEPGDSGGTLLAGDQAQGLTSGVSGDCTSGATSYFQPVQEALDAAGVALLTRTGTPVGPGCDGSSHTLSTTLPAGATATTSAITATRTGFALGCLDGPTGTNFDLYLQRQNADSTWTTVASAVTTAPDEYLTLAVTAGAYRWQIKAVTGSGAVTLGYQIP